MNGVSIVIPAYNADETIYECINSVCNLEYNIDKEIIVINDGSKDRTADIASYFNNVKVINVINGGASKATNIGIQAAKYDLILLLDSDAIIESEWLKKVLPIFDDHMIAAVGGYAITGNKSFIGRVMGYDAEFRLMRIPFYTDHLYTMNTAYRRNVLFEIGMFNNGLKIGYDVDISRRLLAAGYRMVLMKEAKCTHYWRNDLKGYLKQQYNYAYYRLDIAGKYRKPYDKVAGLNMILQVPFTLLCIFVGLIWGIFSPYAFLLLTLPFLIQLPETIKILIWKKDIQMLAMPLILVIRNLTWIWAGIKWSAEKLFEV